MTIQRRKTILDKRIALARGTFVKHYGPGDHPGTGTPQSDHGKQSESQPSPESQPSKEQSPPLRLPPPDGSILALAFGEPFNPTNVIRPEDRELLGQLTEAANERLREMWKRVDSVPFHLTNIDEGIIGNDSLSEGVERGEDGNLRLTPERRLIHDGIVRKFLDESASVPADRQVVILAGLPGSGKTYSIQQDYFPWDSKQFVAVNADEIKETLIEQGLVPDTFDHLEGMEASTAVHEESSLLSKKVREALIAEGRNLILDITGNPQGSGSTVDPGKINREIKRLAGAGYTVNLVMVDADPDEAYLSTLLRMEKPGGRPVPRVFFDQMRTTTRGLDRIDLAFGQTGGYKDTVVESGGRAIVIRNHPVLGRLYSGLADKGGADEKKNRDLATLYSPHLVADSGGAIVKHYGPGPHPSGSSQDVHAGRGIPLGPRNTVPYGANEVAVSTDILGGEEEQHLDHEKPTFISDFVTDPWTHKVGDTIGQAGWHYRIIEMWEPQSQDDRSGVVWFEMVGRPDQGVFASFVNRMGYGSQIRWENKTVPPREWFSVQERLLP